MRPAHPLSEARPSTEVPPLPARQKPILWELDPSLEVFGAHPARVYPREYVDEGLHLSLFFHGRGGGVSCRDSVQKGPR